jgi:choline dehydrogenase-like flavoprotein
MLKNKLASIEKELQ